jgi:hypothetical protein
MPDPVPQVITEIVAGDSLTLAQLAEIGPAHRGEGHMSKSRASRWINPGFTLPCGRVVKLEAAKFGAQLLTSRAALARFLAAINGAPADDAAPTAAPARRVSDPDWLRVPRSA